MDILEKLDNYIVADRATRSKMVVSETEILLLQFYKRIELTEKNYLLQLKKQNDEQLTELRTQA